MPYRPHGHARVDATSPSAFGVCYRCGRWFNRVDLKNQWDYRGNQLQDLKVLVCCDCYDIPQNQLRPILIPQDPVPIMVPSVEQFAQDNAGSISAAEAAQPPQMVPELG